MVTHPLQIERRSGKVRLSETDVLTTELRNQPLWQLVTESDASVWEWDCKYMFSVVCTKHDKNCSVCSQKDYHSSMSSLFSELRRRKIVSCIQAEPDSTNSSHGHLWPYFISQHWPIKIRDRCSEAHKFQHWLAIVKDFRFEDKNKDKDLKSEDNNTEFHWWPAVRTYSPSAFNLLLTVKYTC